MASKLFALAVALGAITTILSILSLSLNYWQGKIVRFKEILDMKQMEAYGGGGGGGEWGGNIQFNPQEQLYLQTTTRSINDLQKMVMHRTDPAMSSLFDSVLSIHGGIWQLCFKVIEIPNKPAFVLPEFCLYLQNIPGVYMPMKHVWIQANWDVPRAMLFLGLFLIVGSVVCVLLRWFMLKDKNILLTVAASLALTAGVFFNAGFSVFADTMKLEDLNYQSAFYFCILAWLTSWATGGVLIYTRVSTKDIDIV